MKLNLLSATAMIAAAMLMQTAAAAETASAVDQAFIAKVTQGGMFEVKLGQLAAVQGSTQDIRDQGDTEAHDHQLVGDKLKSIAGDEGVSFPATLNAAFQAKLDAAKALSGNSFDRRYLTDMMAVHAADGAAFAHEAIAGGDPKLRAFAVETHRIVERHIGELEALPAA